MTAIVTYEKSAHSEWYTGTANAIYQNMDYIDGFNPDYVLILSGDHIYKMDYEVMLDFHKENNAEVTIAVMPVPMEEAKRFGIMITDEMRVQAKRLILGKHTYRVHSGINAITERKVYNSVFSAESYIMFFN